MTKLFGAAAIMLSSFLAAHGKIRAERSALTALHALALSLGYIRSELAERLTPLGEIFSGLEKSAGDAAVSAFYGALARALYDKSELSISSIWTKAAGERLSMLGDGVLRAVLPLGEALGRSDVETLISQLERSVSALEELERAAAAKQPERTRLAYGVALCLGAFVLIVLV